MTKADMKPKPHRVDTTLDCLVRKMAEDILKNREEILRAFIAKYGFEPDRAIQVEQYLPDGTTRWFVRHMTDEELLEYGIQEWRIPPTSYWEQRAKLTEKRMDELEGEISRLKGRPPLTKEQVKAMNLKVGAP